MKSAAFANYHDVNMTLIGLGLFMAIFIGSIVWTGLRANRRIYDRLSQVPLHDEDGAADGGRV